LVVGVYCVRCMDRGEVGITRNSFEGLSRV
jgi:hypothetical protein